MKIEKRSGGFRVRKTYKGRTYSVTFDHRPTKLEIEEEFSRLIRKADITGTFLECAESYIESKRNVLSPSTIKGYYSILRKSLPESFLERKVSDIEQIDIQLLINEYAAEHSPKTTRNVHGFISAVIRQFRPQMVISTTLPQKAVNEAYRPSEDDIKSILDATEGTKWHIPFSLGILGMRRSEICALSVEDLDGTILHINKAMVQSDSGQWVIKATKTAAGTRKIFIPESLADEIRSAGCIYEGYPNTLLLILQKYQKKLGIEQFRFHDLRHFYASYAHSKGMSDADLMASGGWKSDYTLKSVYRHEMEKTKEEMQKTIASSLFD